MSTDHKIAHASLQFADTPAQWKHDCEVIFKRGYEWITGTEGGENDNWLILLAAAKKYGYTARRYKSNWIAVNNSIVKRGTLRFGMKTIIDNDLVAGRGHDTNYITATFVHTTRGVGKVSVVCSHYPTKGTPVGPPSKRINLKWTRKIALAVSARVKTLAAGKAIGFYGGDQNIDDKKADTFFGGPLTSCWDELKYYPGTHGRPTIDVIASYDRDFRVKCVKAKSYNDKALFLHTDHYLIEATYRIGAA